MTVRALPDPKPMAALLLALAAITLALLPSHARCGVRAGVDAYAASVTVRACGVGVIVKV